LENCEYALVVRQPARLEGADSGLENAYERGALTKTQLLIWTGQKLQPDVPLYNIGYKVELLRAVDFECLRSAFQSLVSSSDALRTVFDEIDGAPRQKVLDELRCDVEYVDLSTAVDPRKTSRYWLQTRCQEIFELDKRLFDAALIKLRDQEFIWYLGLHHIIADGWAIWIIHRHLGELYDLALAGLLPDKIDLPSFRDYVLFERAARNSSRYEKAKAYWTSKLAENIERIPFFGRTPPGRTARVARIPWRLGFDVSRRLKDRARQEGLFAGNLDASLFHILAAILATYLYRISGHPRVALGTPFHNRRSKVFKQTIGPFLGMLTLHATVDESDTFTTLMRKLRVETAGAFRYGQYAAANPVHDKNYDAVVNYQPFSATTFGSIPNSVEWMYSGYEEGDSLAVQMHDFAGTGEFVLDFDFRCDVFDDAQRERTVRHFLQLLASFLENPDQLVSQVNFLPAEERRQLLVDFNDTDTLFPEDRPLTQLFEAQVDKTPDGIALVAGTEQLTYRELNARTNQLAHYLRHCRVEPENTVGIFMKPSLNMVVSILGILKAGGAYLPLDPSYPKDRLAYMIQDARVPIVVTQAKLLDNLADLARGSNLEARAPKVVCIDVEWQSVARESSENASDPATGANLAYVIYTSGSTGNPKGAAVHRQGFLNLLNWFVKEFEITATDRTLLMTSLSFDLSQKNLFAPLLCGGELHLSPAGVYDPRRVLDTVKSEQITWLNCTPSACYPLIDTCANFPGELGPLRYLFLGGEPISVPRLWKWLQADQIQTRVVNTYGPTECTDVTSFAVLAEPERFMEEAVPVGKPIHNSRLYVLDRGLGLLPAGFAGELCIGGKAVGRGYLNDAPRTAERFRPDPFVDTGSRLYRTGDLARCRFDGNIEFGGRMDHQVKVRGFRVELGEIEAVLGKHPAVQGAVAHAVEDVSGIKRLVGYVVPRKSFDPAEVKSYLRGKLPEYMVPAVFVMLESLPLTSSGKVDRKALPGPNGARAELAGEYAAPRTAVEEVLAGIWSAVLGVEKVGIDDDFFELGGHSLLATQVVSRVQQAFAVELPLSRLFQAPTVADTAQFIDGARRTAARVATAPLIPVSRDMELPVSFAQLRLWLFDQLAPNSPLYNLGGALRLSGRLEVSSLSRALDAIIQRHEVLRTTFSAVDGRPIQVIAPLTHLKLPEFDLSALPEVEREREVERLAREEALRPFNLSWGPLFRVGLIKLGAEDHVVPLTIHHIVFDGWSMAIFVREFGLLYEAFTQGRRSPLSELPVQYADFAVWQRQWLQGEVVEQQFAYWEKQLAGVPAVIDLPTDRQRTVTQSFRGAGEPITLSTGLTEGLRALSRKEGATLFMTLLAALQTLLFRYTHQKDIVVGTPVAGRNRAEIEGLIGFFLNTLVLRGDLCGNPTFREFLAQVRETTLGAYMHQDFPFEQLVEKLQAHRDLSYAPLFQVLFVLQNVPTETLELPGLRLSLLEEKYDAISVGFDLTLALTETSTGVNGVLEYDRHLFEPATVRRMVAHLVTLLEGIVEQPDQRVSALTLLTEAEQQQLLVTWNDTARAYDEERTWVEVFETQVECTPDALAVAFEDERVTYRELNRRGDQLAHYLRALGVGPEVLVAILMDRSLRMLVGILGIFKAGGAYVPLDPNYPGDRLAFMLRDARAPVVLTEQKYDPAQSFDGTVVYLDAPWGDIARHGEGKIEVRATPRNLAYVIYTSGSTGLPKGVMIEHRGMLNHLQAKVWELGLTGEDAVAQTASQCFDISVWQFLVALSVGGHTHIFAEDVSFDPSALPRGLANEGISIFETVPSLLRAIVPEAVRTDLSGLRWLIATGEALPLDLCQDWLHEFPQIPLMNAYGPTECSDDVTHYVTAYSPEDTAHVPIGHALPNTQLYVMDEGLGLSPIGVAGELCVGGHGVGRGYLNDAARTAERVVPDPHGQSVGGRVYRTGDLTGYLPDGNLTFLGRIDNQVKVRGFRIELGEIETILTQHPSVQEAVVVAGKGRPPTTEDRGSESEARQAPTNPQQLIAYVVGRDGESLASDVLRQHVQRMLPDYMVPSAFVAMETMPLTPNGKIDRVGLPEPAGVERIATFTSPRTPTEDMLAGIWSEVLGIDNVGVHDDFFELGGHSLLATQVISRIRRVFSVDLALRDLFQVATIAGIADKIEAARAREPRLRQAPLLPVSRDRDMLLSVAQQRLWFFEQLMPGTSVYNMATAVRFTGRLDIATMWSCLSTVVQRHESLRTTFAWKEEGPIQVFTSVLAVRSPVVDLEGLPELERERETHKLALEEAHQPFDLTHGPLWRATLIRLGGESHVALFTMHHIIADGWSVGVLIRELGILYEAFSQGRPSPLPSLPIQYADFAVWQREWLRGEVLDQQLSYWKDQLAGVPALLALPTDRPRPAVQTYRGAAASVHIPCDLSEALQELSRQEGVTLFMTLLAGFQVLLHRYTAQQDIVVGSPVAGRNRAEIEGLIGCFLNTLVLRGNLSGNPRFREFLRHVREVTLDAYTHQDVPFEQLVESLQPGRDLSHTPLFQVMFIVQNAPQGVRELPGLTWRILGGLENTAQFDLVLSLTEEESSLLGSMEYNTDLFDAGTVDRLLDHWVRILRGVVTDPEQHVSELPLLSAAELDQVLTKWNDTATAYPTQQCIHQLFEVQVERTPEAVAVVFEEEQVTYRELNQKANQLAHYLRALGVGPEVLVGIMMERSVDMVVGLLGILKAGGGYVPLDPSYPKDRIAFMIHDARTAVLLTHSGVEPPSGDQPTSGISQHSVQTPNTGARAPRVVCLDQDAQAIAQQRSANPVNATEPQNSAYVIYTSGSTGTPKAAVNAHAGILNRLIWMQEAFQLTEADAVLQKTPFSFDVSVWEFFWPLMTGARLVAARPEGHKDSGYLVSVIRDEHITTMHFVPSMLQVFVDEEGIQTCESLIRVICSGEALSFQLQQRFFSRSDSSLHNLYGPTEAAVDVTCWDCQRGDSRGVVPIGKPIANTQIYVINDSPVPLGVAGEIQIGGVGLARGYLSNVDLTAERFVPDPYGTEAGGRLYRTGDRARYMPDGAIDFLGRLDHQVKIRGFRIELGEIETVLAQHPAVREAVVVAGPPTSDRRPQAEPRTPNTDPQRLVAYVVFAGEAAARVSELRNFLEAKLPDYMVPSAFMFLGEFPLTPNGKVDMRALPDPKVMRQALEKEYVAPRTPLEESLAGIWREVLAIERVGVHDSFFELGGHSLLAIRVISRIRSEYQIELPLRPLFEKPTIEGLAEIIEDVVWVGKAPTEGSEQGLREEGEL